MKCPVCNSEMKKVTYPYKVKIGNGESESFLNSYECNSCGYDIADKSNRKIISNTIANAQDECAYNILNEFKKDGKNFSEIERKFFLPSRTLSKWLNKKTKPSAAALALLRIIKAFPWMEKVADLDFDTPEAQKYVRNYYYTEFNDNEKIILHDSFGTTQIYIALINQKGNFSEINSKYIPMQHNSYSYLSM